jgi:prepilin-type N-terminal cleavage/methylation domain-containing protein
MSVQNRQTDRGEEGFSLIELMVVAMIIAIAAGFALPAISQYLKNYRIRGAAQQIASQLQVVRSKAIIKNVSLGAIWVIRDNNSSGWVMEDDLQPQTPPNWVTVAQEGGGAWATLIADTIQMPGGFVTLPFPVVFDDPANCPGGGAASTEWGLRFNRLGGQCGMPNTCAPDPPAVPAYTPYITYAGGNATVCLLDSQVQLRRLVTITAGGRVRVL